MPCISSQQKEVLKQQSGEQKPERGSCSHPSTLSSCQIPWINKILGDSATWFFGLFWLFMIWNCWGGICLCGLPWVVWVIESHNSINPGREFDFLYTLWKFQYWRHNCINWGTELNILYTFLRVHYWRQPALGCCALAVTGFWPMGRRRLTGAGWCAAPAWSICALYWHPEAGAANWKALVQSLLDLSIG